MPRKLRVTYDEIICSIAAKEIKDGERVFIGTGYPVLIADLARKFHAPNAVLITENGMIDYDAYRPLLYVNDFASCKGASMCIDLFETFGAHLLKGSIDIAFLSAAEVDKYGNINSSYSKGMHIAGSGGQNEIGGYAKRTVISVRHGIFAEKCEYITTPGYLDGYDSRYKAGLPPGTGPVAVFSQKGIFRFDEATKEMYLESYHPGVTVEEIEKEIPWSLKVAPNVKMTPLPTEEELNFMRNWAPMICLGRSFFIQVMINHLQKFMQEARSLGKSK